MTAADRSRGDAAVVATRGRGAAAPGRVALEALVVLLAVLAYLWPFRLYGFDVVDEGVQLVQIERAAHGERPYVDFETSYTPGYFAVHAALWHVAGEGLATTRTAGVVLHAGIAAAAFAVLRVWAGGLVAIVATALYVAFLLPVSLRFGAPFNTPYPGWLAAALALGAQVATAAVASGRTTRRDGAARAALLAGVAGVLAGLAFSVKPNSGVLALGGVALAATAGWHPSGAGSRRLGLAIRIAAAAGGVVLLWSGFSWTAGVALLLPLWLAAWRVAAAGDGLVERAPASAARDTGAAIAQLAAAATGFVAVVAPWLAVLCAELGVGRALGTVLHVEGSVVRAYLVPFEPPWPATIALGAGLCGAAALARPGGGSARVRLAPWALAVAVVVAAALAAPAGARLAAENAVLWLGPAGLALAIATASRDASAAASRERALLAFAAVYQLQLHPRPDLMHVAMGGAPVVVALGVAWARAVRGWGAGMAAGTEAASAGLAASPSRLPAVPRRAAAIAAAVALVLAAGRAAPTLVARLREPVVDLGLGERAPIVMSASHAAELAWLGEAVRAIREHGGPGDALFAFPDLAGLGFLAGRPMPFYYLYFVPGRPDHEQEVEVIARLEAVRPAVVAMAPPSVPAFAGATEYFARTVRWIEERYVPIARVGSRAILVPRSGKSPR